MQKAMFYIETGNGNVDCQLCPWNCKLKPGQTGVCRVRTNKNGKLFTSVFNKVAALAIDPIEKKPLYHFYPGKTILSIGEVGCNLHCNFCQNYHISQCNADDFNHFRKISASQIIEQAVSAFNNIGIAYTYNEPFTFYEFMLNIAQEARSKNLKNVVVSNGYINKKPLQKLLPFIDAFNIDLKAFTNEFYTKQTKGQLQPVLSTIKTIAKSNSHLEITFLIIPGLNDSLTNFQQMVKWIRDETGANTPLHLSRYFPQYKLQLKATPVDTLIDMYHLSKKYLHHVYLGNVNDNKHSSTYCNKCGKMVIERNFYETKIVSLNKNGICNYCQHQVLTTIG